MVEAEDDTREEVTTSISFREALRVWCRVAMLSFGGPAVRKPFSARPQLLHVPAWTTIDVMSVLIAVGAFVAMFRFQAGMLKTLMASAGLGMAYFLLMRS